MATKSSKLLSYRQGQQGMPDEAEDMALLPWRISVSVTLAPPPPSRSDR